jgi:hypothetical protein
MKAAEDTLLTHAEELYDETEREAARCDADRVSSEYVRRSAITLRIERGSSYSDVFLAVGPTLVGLAGGIWTTTVTAATPTDIPGWVSSVAVAAACAGTTLIGAGIALKLKR